MIQFRDKSGDGGWRQSVAASLRALCSEFGAPFVVNDDVQLAASVGASGVHLGRQDATVREAREAIGADCLIGVSCYNVLDRAREAANAGADYVAFGSLFASPSKPQAVHCPLGTLTRARAFGLPVVAIGGITPDNGASAIAAGADSLAVISAVFDAPDVRRAAESFSRLWAQP